MSTRVAAVVTVAAALVLAASAAGAPDDLTLVSRLAPADGGAAGNASSYQPTISANGRFAAFVSEATNFPGAGNGAYVKDLTTGALELVSRADGAAGAPGAALANRPSISADGTRVAFLTGAALDPIDTDGGDTDVYVRDRATHDTQLASVDSSETPLPSTSYKPAISADGQHVAFQSGSAILVRHLAAGTTETASRRPDDLAAANSSHPSISADGTRVAFTSNDPDASTEDAPGWLDDVFVRDLVAGTTTLVSRTDDEQAINGFSSTAEMAADGRHVVFKTYGTNLPTGGTPQLYERDLVAGTTTLVSRATGEGAAADGIAVASDQRFSVSADGRRVSWSTAATNLSAADVDDADDVFVRDVVTAETWLVSRAAGATGAGADDDSSFSVLSGDGTRVVFDSRAGNLSAEDGDPAFDVFLRELPPIPAPVVVEPPVTQPPAVQPPAVVVPAPAPPATVRTAPSIRAADVIRLPSTRTCVSRRRLRITIRRPSGLTVREVRVQIKGRRTVVVKGAKLKAPVDLRGLPRGTFKVTVTARLSDGRTLKIARTYRTCRARRAVAG